MSEVPLYRQAPLGLGVLVFEISLHYRQNLLGRDIGTKVTRNERTELVPGWQYRGTSPIRKAHPPWDPPRTLGMSLR
jgi:hypothetical protein